jgi:pyruvate dehydrogenase E1 component alpha subunit
MEEWKKADPIPRFAINLMEAGIFTEEDIDEIDASAKRDIDDATEIALTLPEPDPLHVEDEVYAP